MSKDTMSTREETRTSSLLIIIMGEDGIVAVGDTVLLAGSGLFGARFGGFTAVRVLGVIFPLSAELGNASLETIDDGREAGRGKGETGKKGDEERVRKEGGRRRGKRDHGIRNGRQEGKEK